MPDIDKLIQALLQFRNERDKAEFHDGDHLVAGISIEATVRQ